MLPLQGIPTFLKSYGTKYGFMGVPFDMASSGRPGASLAPNEIRMASLFLTDGEHPHYHIDPATLIKDLGDMPLSSGDLLKALEIIENNALNVFKNYKRALFAGGNHLITLPILRAAKQAHGDFVLIHLDAHCDTWKDHFGDKYGHGTFLRNAIEENIIKAENVQQIGIRSPVDRETRKWLYDQGGRTHSMKYFHATHSFMENLNDWIAGRKVYITFDIDVLDPAFAPGTGTPECGGMTTREALFLIEEIKGKFIGMDVVEVNPMIDHANITSLAAATLLWTFASK